MNPYFEKLNVEIVRINNKVARSFVETHHYTHSVGLCKVSYGIFYTFHEEDPFFSTNVKKLIGCIIYSQPVGRSAAASLSDAININEVFELTRLVCLDGINYGRNIESYCISKSFKLLNRDFPHIKVVLSYADGEQGHRGIIYQATGFYYQGNSTLALMPNFSLSLVGPDKYEWIHSRTVTSKWGSCNVDHLKRCIGHTFFRKKESKKHRYIIFICPKPEKRKLLKSLKHPILPYPKSTSFLEEIEEITVTNNVNETFF